MKLSGSGRPAVGEDKEGAGPGAIDNGVASGLLDRTATAQVLRLRGGMMQITSGRLNYGELTKMKLRLTLRTFGGVTLDTIDITGLNSTYNRLLLNGGVGDDSIFGHDGPDKIIGGSGFDILAGYSGVDVILGGDESLALVDGAVASTTQEADLSAFYQSDGTPYRARTQ